jgi:hypothetical protein
VSYPCRFPVKHATNSYNSTSTILVGVSSTLLVVVESYCHVSFMSLTYAKELIGPNKRVQIIHHINQSIVEFSIHFYKKNVKVMIFFFYHLSFYRFEIFWLFNVDYL